MSAWFCTYAVRFSDSITRKQTAEVDIIYALESERQVRAEVK